MTRRKLARVAVRVAVMAGLLAGCGGGGSSKPITETDFCSQIADAQCQVTSQCVTSKDACKVQRMTVCTGFVSQAKASGKRVFVPGNVGTCVAKTQAYYAKTTAITPADMADMNEACNYVFQGDGEVSLDMCDVKYDCAGRVICDKGFCATAKTVTGGCANSGDLCPAGQYCTANASNQLVCMPRGNSGDNCSATMPCLEALRCAGTCMTRVAAADPCTSNDDCPTTAPYCDPYAGSKCDQGLSFAAGSASCADYGGGSSTGTGGTGGSGGGTGGSGGGGTGGGGGTDGGGGSASGGSTGAGGTGGAGGTSG